MLCFAVLLQHTTGSAVSSKHCCIHQRLGAMNSPQKSVLSVEACQAFLGPDHTSIRVNWPVHAGSMTDICGERDTSIVPLCCAREAAKALCELSLEATGALQVQLQGIRKGWLSEHKTDIVLHPHRASSALSALRERVKSMSKVQAQPPMSALCVAYPLMDNFSMTSACQVRQRRS